ncbi:phosphatidate cytidylyltransferase [Clavibacter tessellarius]
MLLTAGDGGEWWTLAFLILVVCCDTGAYVAGLNFGKHPMAPTISPKKTWRGSPAPRSRQCWRASSWRSS